MSRARRRLAEALTRWYVGAYFDLSGDPDKHLAKHYGLVHHVNEQLVTLRREVVQAYEGVGPSRLASYLVSTRRRFEFSAFLDEWYKDDPQEVFEQILEPADKESR